MSPSISQFKLELTEALNERKKERNNKNTFAQILLSHATARLQVLKISTNIYYYLLLPGISSLVLSTFWGNHLHKVIPRVNFCFGAILILSLKAFLGMAVNTFTQNVISQLMGSTMS